MADVHEYGDQVWRHWSGMHRMLLRFAGRLPDAYVNELRELLAGGEIYKAADRLAGAVVELGLAIDVGDVALVREVTRAFYGTDPEIMVNEGVSFVISPELPATDHRFFPVSAEVLAGSGDRIPPTLDFTGGADDDLWNLPPGLDSLRDLALELTDVDDQNLVVPADQYPDVLSVSRAWRFPAEGPPAGGIRIALVEVRDHAPAWEIENEIKNLFHLWRTPAEPDLMVEVYWASTELPPYHRAALAGAAKFLDRRAQA